MRFLSITIGLFTILRFTNAQSYQMLSLDAVYQEHVSHSYVPCSNGGVFIYYFADDTTIGSFNYHKLHYQGNYIQMCSGYPTATSYFPDKYLGAIRQDATAGRVYIWLKDSATEMLLYDFTLSTGDTMHFIPGGYASIFSVGELHRVIDSVDTVLVDGMFRKRMYYTNYSCDWCFTGPNAVVEGIGNTRGFIFPRTTPDPNAPRKTLSCVTLAGDKIFGTDSVCYQPMDSIGYSAATQILTVGHNLEIAYESHDNVCLHTEYSGNNQLAIVVYDVLGVPVRSAAVDGSITCIDKRNFTKAFYVIGFYAGRQRIGTAKWVNR